MKREKVGAKIGLLFGPEEKGLSNESLAYCDRLIAIPANTKFPSLNLSQAVMVIAYELSVLKGWMFNKEVSPPPATKKSLEGMLQHLEEVLREIDYIDRQNPFRNRVVLRSIFRKVRPTEGEIFHLRAIYRKTLRRLRQDKGGS